jgi:hypothetical protein
MVMLRGKLVDEVGIRLRIVQKDPNLWWGAIVGDVTHDLRSALDHLVWELTTRFSGEPPSEPPPSKSVWRDAAFPIILKAQNWHVGLRAIRGIDPSLVERFEALQPFRNPDYGGLPETHPLWILHCLWNRDKHRTINVTRSLVALDRVGSEPPESGLAELQTKIIESVNLGPFDDGAELARVQVLSPGMNMEAIRVSMNMNLHFAFDIAFAEGAPAGGMLVMKILKGLYDIVETILHDFEADLK